MTVSGPSQNHLAKRDLVSVDVVGPTPTDQLGIRASEDRAHRRIHTGRVPIEVHDHGPDLGLLEDDLESCFGGPAHLFGGDTIGVVHHRAMQSRNTPIGVLVTSEANPHETLDGVVPDDAELDVEGGGMCD